MGPRRRVRFRLILLPQVADARQMEKRGRFRYARPALLLVGLCSGLWSASGLLQKLEQGEASMAVPGLDQIAGLERITAAVGGAQNGPELLTPEGDALSNEERRRLMREAESLAPIPLDRDPETKARAKKSRRKQR